MELYEVKAVLTSDIKSFLTGLSEASQAIGDFKGSTGNLSQAIPEAMGSIGKGMTLGFTVPIVGAMAAGVKSFAEFDSNLRQTMAAMGQYTDENGKFTGQAAKDYEILSSKAKEWGQESIYSSTEVAGAMEILASRGFDVNGILGMTPGVINLAAAAGMKGSAGIESAANAMGSAMQQFDSQGLESTHVADVFAQATADTALKGMGLADALKYVGTTASSNNISFEETAAALGVMSNGGLQAEQSGRYLSMALSKMARPSKEAKEIMEELGITFYDSEGNMKSLSDNTAMLREKFAGLTDEQRQYALSTIFGEQAGRGMNALLNETTGELEVLTNSFINSEGASQKMADTINSGLSGAFEKMGEAIGNAFLAIGEVLEPMVIEAAEWIEKLVEKFNALDEGTQEFIVTVGLIVAAIGPLLMLFSALFTPIMQIGTALAGVIGFLIANPWVLFAAAAVAAVVLIIKNWEGIKEFFSNLWETLKTSASEVWESITTKFSEGVNKLKENWNQIKENAIKSNEELKERLVTLWENIKTAISTAWDNIKTTVTEKANAVKEIVSKVWDTIKTKTSEIWESIKEVVSKVWENIKTAVETAINAVKTTVTTVWENIKKGTDEKWKAIQKAIKDAWDKIKENVKTAIDNVKKTVSEGFTNLVTTVTEKGEEIVTQVKTAWNNAINGAKEFISQAIQVGKDIIGGFIQGVTGKARELANAASNAVSGAINAAKGMLGIKSPSRVFMGIGENTMDGFAIGIKDNSKEPLNAIKRTMSDIKGVYSNTNFASNLGTLSGSINSKVDYMVKDNLNNRQSATINLSMGSKVYRYFVEDISNAQGQEAQLIETFGY